MSVRISRRLTPEQQADELARANLKQLESAVLSVVQRKLLTSKIRLDKSDVEAAYNLGWHGVCQYIAQGGEVSNLTGFLIDITYKRAFDVYRQRHEGQHADVDLEEHGVEVDLAGQVDDQLKLQRLLARLKDRLNENERKGVTLCLLHGFKRPEAADMLGIEQAAFQRIMDSATKKLAGIVAQIDARGCGGEEWARLLRSYALGILTETDPDYPRVLRHIEECESCARYVTGLQGLAAVLPPVGLPFVPILGHEHAILAHISRMFGGGHGASGGAAAAQAAGGTASASAGGGTLVGSISVGAVAKGTAVIAIAVVAVSLKSDHDARKHHRAPARAAAVQTAPAAVAPALPPQSVLAYTPRKTQPQATHNLLRKPSRKASHRSARQSTYSPPPHVTAAVPRAASAPESEVEREFEIEPSSRGASTPSQDQSASAASEHSSAGGVQSARAAEEEFSPER